MSDGEARAEFQALNERIGSLRQQCLELKTQVEQLSAQSSIANKQRLEDLKEWLEDIVESGWGDTDGDDGYEVACKDALKKLEEPRDAFRKECEREWNEGSTP